MKTVYPLQTKFAGGIINDIRVNVGTFGQCRYNRTFLYFLDNFSATSVVIAMCNPDKSH